MKRRINYIDSMRGFTMFLVVFGHVMLYSFGLGGYSTIIGSIFLTFRMPMFFFISGYIAYKSIDNWTLSFFKTRLFKKAQIQIIPAVLFFSLFCFTRGFSPLSVLKFGWGDYWFTFVLFEMFVFYYLLSFIGNKTTDKVVDIGLIFLSCLGIFWLVIANRGMNFYQIICMENLAKYMQFFSFGILCRKYNDLFFKLISCDSFKTIIVIIYVVGLFLYFNDSLKASSFVLYSLNHDILVRYFGVLLVFLFFYSKRDYFDKDNRIVNSFLFVGRRTLDIYLIHFFLLPNLKFMKELLQSNDILLIHLFIGSIIALLIIVVCLLISEIIRTSNFLGHYLLGAKRV